MNKIMKTKIDKIDAFVCKKSWTDARMYVIGEKGIIEYLTNNTPGSIEQILSWAADHGCSVGFDHPGKFKRQIHSKKTQHLLMKSGFYLTRNKLEAFAMLKYDEILNQQPVEFQKNFNMLIDGLTTEDDVKEFMFSIIGNAAL